eukprot:4880087-Prymnesium_polylepis.1
MSTTPPMGDAVRTLDAGNWLELTIASERAVQIFVIDTMGRTQTVDVVLSHTVALAAKAILEKLGMVEGTDMWLMFEGKVLEAPRTLSAYGIRGHSTVQVVPRGRGGGSTNSSVAAFGDGPSTM